MNKLNRTKKGVLVGVTVFLIGAVIFVVSFAVLGWDIYALDTATYTAKSYERADDAPMLTKIVLNVDSFKIEVRSGESFKLDYYEASDSAVTVKDEGGVLTVTEKDDFGCGRFGNFNIGRFKYKYSVVLPAGVEIEVKSSNTNVSFSGIESPKLLIAGSNANVTLDNCNITELTVSSSNLDVSVENCILGETKITGSNLDADISDCVSHVIYLSGSNANVDILRTAVDVLTVHGSNLDADISIKGVKSEYTIITSGRGMPASQTGTDPDKKISLSGSNCDVDLVFV